MGEEQEERRCARGARCALSTPVRDEAGQPTGTRNEAATLNVERGLCRADERNLRRALTEFPELRAQLAAEQIPHLSVTYREIDISTSALLHSPVPIAEYPDALARLLDHELTAWAEFTADAIGLDWSTKWEQMSREGGRIQRACQLLSFRFDQFIAIGRRYYRARSLTASPYQVLEDADDTWFVEFDPDMQDFMLWRDAIGAGVVLLDLHRRIREIAGLQAVMRSPIPCRSCKRRQVERDTVSLTWTCRGCGDTRSDRVHTEDSEAATREAS